MSLEMCNDPPEVVEAARIAIENLLPTKSAAVYEAAFVKFNKWCNGKKVVQYSENVLLAYFTEMALKMKSSSLWAHYSMIRSVLNLKHNVNIEKYNNLRAFLKKQEQGYKPKKSRVLSREQFSKFLSEAPDEKYLAMKVVLIFGISGACRCDELVNMTVDDLEDMGSLLLINIPNTKTNKLHQITYRQLESRILRMKKNTLSNTLKQKLFSIENINLKDDIQLNLVSKSFFLLHNSIQDE